MRFVLRIYRSLRLRTKLLALFALPMIALLGGCLLYNSIQTVAREQQAEVDSYTAIISAAAQDFERVYTLQDQTVAADTSTWLRSFENIRRVYVIDPEARVVFAYTKPGLVPQPLPQTLQGPAPQLQHRFTRNTLELLHPVELGPTCRGMAFVEASTAHLAEETQRSLTRTILVTLAALIGSFALSLLLQNIVARPVLQITDFVNRACAQHSYSAKLSVEDDAELGSLARGINALLHSIQEHEASLRSLNASLQQIVDLRTRELSEALEAARAASNAKSNFLANMSHEIRTPMTAIVGFSELLRDESQTPEQRREYVQTITRNGEHLLALINDILDLSKIEAGKMSVERIDCSPLEILQQVESLMSVRAAAKRLPLHLEPHFPLPARMKSDPVRLRQILVNFVGNAVKFTKTGSVRLRLSYDSGSSQLRYEVIDTGIGMSQELIGRLFQPFMQADESTARKFGGTGLGLTISQRLATMLGGKIDVNSAPGEGTRFVLSFPVDATAAADFLEEHLTIVTPRARPEAESAQFNTPVLQGVQILLAEDGPDNQRLITFLLTRAGAQVTLAENGQAAIDAATAPSAAYNLVLMDMQMPEVDGYEASRILRSRGFTIPVIALTAHAMSGDRERCLEAGCSGFLSKPVNRAELIRTILQHVGQDDTPLKKSA